MGDKLKNLIEDAVAIFAKTCVSKDIYVATAESCTGGLVGHALTQIPGSSDWYAGGVVAYSNNFKNCLLSVDDKLIEKHGAVSREVVCAMAKGITKYPEVNMGLAVSGIAGPGGGTGEKPVGLVYMAVCLTSKIHCKKYLFKGNRSLIKEQSALNLVKFASSVLMEKVR